MKVLQINKFLKIVGGAETYMFTLSALLEKKGVKVAFWGMEDEANKVLNPYGELAPNLDFKKENQKMRSAKKLSTIIYSRENQKRLAGVLDEFKPDIVHIHNYNFQLTTSILSEIKRRGIKIVHTIHDSQLVCPVHRLYIEHKNEVCTRCLYGKFYNAVKHKCFDNSRAKSILGSAESYFAHNIKNAYNKYIDAFISPSKFFKDKIQPVIEREIVVLPNCVESKTVDLNLDKENYVLFFGRLSVEKGLNQLYQLFGNLDYQLKIVGKGELIPEGYGNIEYLGPKYGTELFDLVAKARFTIHPSYWYENCPMSIVESLMLGTPVIVANSGGLPEMISDKTGYVIDFFAEDTLKNLEQILERSYNFSSEEIMNFYQENYGEQKHVEKVLNLYQRVLAN
ncbi:glycosyltransferase [Flagellimonas flava]|uniref:Glycosyltransferase involved in cell wall bisynthesis n=1 Tax=Flagellimonas flava TaxID=570519 RepID=A0A1M5L1E2_9FLAO|nr:glycosyltransferase [Allomuricauda flava]SHG58806.1 Glycosyltransferase involved in cell wall bisynthesis [Allomuricauda flava]